MTLSAEDLKRWAHEHLVYEAKMLVHSAERVADARLSDPDRNAFIESFAIHVRCLSDFLWRDSRPKTGPEDAIAADFCAPGAWARARPTKPDVLRQVDPRRIGREIVHLTYHRLGIDDEAKQWPMGALLHGIAEALACFGDVADPQRLDDKTGKALASLTQPIQTEARSLMYANLMEVTVASQAIRPGPGTIAFPGHSSDDVSLDSGR